MSLLIIDKINKSYNGIKIINNFSMELNSGEIISIIGPSGAGKTTLLRCINGLEKIDSGTIKIENNSIARNEIKKEIPSVGLVFQDFQLFPQYSVLNNIILPLRKVIKTGKEEARKVAIDLLDKMELSEKQNMYPYQLSGGEKQRLAIARILAIKPKIICFDEPTSALDFKLIEKIAETIKKLANENKAILIVTHDINFAKKISNKIIEFKKITI